MGRDALDGGTDSFSAGEAREEPEHPVTVSTFRLDKFEVTVGRFRRFFDAYDGTPPAVGAGANPHVENSGWDPSWDPALPADRATLETDLICDDVLTWTSAPSIYESRPMACTTWYEAFAFCAWDGGRLPTEAEWEYAAAGGPENRRFPWGADPPDDQNQLAVVDCAFGGTPGTCDITDIPAVGSFPGGRGRYGQMDLAGSVMEAVLDFENQTFYGEPSATGTDVANLTDSSEYREVRGGNWITAGIDTRAAKRLGVHPRDRWDGVGFRCARDP